MKFSDMPYERPDIEAAKARLAALTSALRSATSFADAERVFLEEEKHASHLQTLHALAYIRHSIDTRDAFYDEEIRFWNAAIPDLGAAEQAWTLALLESPFRPDFAAKYGDVVFRNAEIEFRSFSPAIVAELREENDLTQAYEKLLASAQIPFEGGVYTIAQLAPFKNDPDDARRLAAWQAEGAWYRAHGAELDGIYDRLVHLRDAMGRKLGYADYIPLGYDRMGRNCYGQSDVEKFRLAVQKYVVPLADGIYREQAKRLGKAYPMNFADNALAFRSGNPRPVPDADGILAHARTFYDDLSPETSAFFRMMLENGLLDVLSTEGKAGGGYCEEIRDYGVPFIFANFNGTRADVETVTHEAGHAFAAYLNRARIPASTALPTLEGCEVHSMSMEFLAWSHAEGFFGDDTRKFYYSHLSGALTFLPYGTMVDHFQHIMYEKPDLTPAERHGVWRELHGIYMPWVRLDGEIPFYGDGEGWQRQHHIYSSPFYYIDYCLAQTVALEIWAEMQKDPAAAWERYMAYTEQGGSRVFTELLQEAGLRSPFDEKCLAEVSTVADAWLRAFDLTGIA